VIAPIIMQGRHVAPGQEGGREREREESGMNERWKSICDGLRRREGKKKARWTDGERVLKQEGEKRVGQ